MIIEKKIQQLTDLPALASYLIDFFQKNGKKVVFQGEIGAGKTTLIKEICKQLEVKDNVSSPTFSLVNIYNSPNDKIYHLDLYRLKTETEAIQIGIEDYLFDQHMCFIEWPELIEAILPEDIIVIKITTQPDESRLVQIAA